MYIIYIRTLCEYIILYTYIFCSLALYSTPTIYFHDAGAEKKIKCIRARIHKACFQKSIITPLQAQCCCGQTMVGHSVCWRRTRRVSGRETNYGRRKTDRERARGRRTKMDVLSRTVIIMCCCSPDQTYPLGEDERDH